MDDKRKPVIEYIGEAALLEQLAEEACELGHAALKLARVLRMENPTPVSKEKATDNLIEEFTDVVLCANSLDLKTDKKMYTSKMNRFYDRMAEFDINRRKLKLDVRGD